MKSNISNWKMPRMTAILFVLTLVHFCCARDYTTMSCLCQLDSHLMNVRQKLSANQDYSPTPTTTTTTSAPEIITVDSNSTASSSEAALNETATEPTITEATVVLSRRKRELKITNEKRFYQKGVVGPTGLPDFDKNITIVDDVGVFYNEDYNATLCSCKKGSSGSIKMCFTNIRYISAYDSIVSAESREHLARLLPWAHNNFLNGLAQFYLRVLPLELTKFNGQLQVHFGVDLNATVFKPDYHIKTAFETSSVRDGNIKIQNKIYKTDIENHDCYFITDTSPPIHKPKTLMDSLKYIFLVLAFVVVALLCLVMCVGKRDAFYVRFW